MADQNKSIIIIGAGLGGLSSGVYAQMNGFKSRIFEMHEIPGGCCTSWNRRDYIFDQCISWLLGSGSNNKMNQIWNELGALNGKKVKHFDVFNRVYTSDGKYVDFYSDPDKLEQHLLELSPEDEEHITMFCSDLRSFFALTDAHPFLKPVGLMNIWEKVKMYAPYLLRVGLVGRAHSTLISDFSERFQSPTLKEAFNYIFYEKHESFPLLPFYFNMACAAQKNAGVPEGGSLGLAKSIEQRFKRLGGIIDYNSKVDSIIIENDRAIGIELADGSKHYSDIVISASDGVETTKRLLKDNYRNTQLDKLYKDVIKEKKQTFPSYFTVFLGVNKDYSDHSHCSSYVLPKEIQKNVPGMLHPSINVQVRNQHYPHIAPKGKSVIFISFFCDYVPWSEMCQSNNHAEKLTNKKRHTKRRRTVEYRTKKKQAAAEIIDFIAQHFDDLKDNIEYTDIATPLTQERYTGNHHGTVLAWQPFLASGELIEKTINKQGPRIPGLANFYMAGHWTTTGGLIRAASTGRHVIQYVCKDEKKSFHAYHDDPQLTQEDWSALSHYS